MGIQDNKETMIIGDYGVKWIVVRKRGRFRVYSGPRWQMSGQLDVVKEMIEGMPAWYSRIERLEESGWKPHNQDEEKIKQKYPLIARYYKIMRRTRTKDLYWLCGYLFTLDEILGGEPLLDKFEANIHERIKQALFFCHADHQTNRKQHIINYTKN